MYPLPPNHYAPRNHWYVAAWAAEIGRTPIERWILDEPVALYRTEAGTPVALAGRCPHRHYPLGKSPTVGDNLECGYHGITFAPSGECVRIPSQVQVPQGCRVKAYPVVQRWEWIWIWTGDPAAADASLIPDAAETGLGDPAFKFETGGYHPVPGRYMLMHDNICDLSHLSYLHKTSIGSGDFDSVEELRDGAETWISSHREFKGIECPPYFATLLGQPGRIDRHFGMKLHVPCLHVGYDCFFRPGEGDAGPGEPLGAITIFHAITPATRHTAHYFFTFGRNFMVDDVAFGQAMLAGLGAVAKEDMVATGHIESMLGTLAEEPRDLLLKADANCVRGRRLFEAAIRKEMVGA